MIKTFLNVISNLIFDIVKQDKTKIVYTSFPDFSDNTFAFFIFILNLKKQYKNIWLVDKKDINVFKKITGNYSKSNNYKVYRKKSLLGIYHFFTSSFTFHTHGIYNNFGLIKKHTVVNLWHGMPIKKVGFYENNNNYKNYIPSNYHISTSNFYKSIFIKIFKTNKNNVLTIGQPRNDFLFSNQFHIHQIFSKKKHNKAVLWMPTYRKAIIGDVRKDGEKLSLLNKESLEAINLFLLQNKIICYLKIHPMDFMKKNDFDYYSNIVILDNNTLNDKGIHLYSLLNSVDLLLTDFSSVYIDYLLLDKPIGFVFSDFEKYFNSRGFVFEDPKKYMPGEIITNQENLILFLKEVLVNKKDRYKEERKKITELFHDLKEDFSKNIFNRIIEDV